MTEEGDVFLLYNSQICRLCAEENSNGYSLFSSECSDEDTSILINSYLPLKIFDDAKYPRWICPGCHLQVETTVQFFNLVMTGQKKLKQLYDAQCVGSVQEEEEEKSLEELLVSNEKDPDSSILRVYTKNRNENSLLLSLNNLYDNEHEIVQNMSCDTDTSPNPPKRKRGRPRKQPPKVLTEEEKNKIAEEIDEKLKSVDNSVDVDENGRRRRRIKVPLRFQEAVQGKELERIYIEKGVIDKSDLGSDVDENGETRNNREPIYPEDVIGHVQDEEGVNLGDLVVFNNNQKSNRRHRITHKKKTRFMCDICKIYFCYEQKFLLHRSSHQNVRYECNQCLQSFSDRLLLSQHQNKFQHEGEGIIEGFEVLNLVNGNNEKQAQFTEISQEKNPNITSHIEISKQSAETDSKDIKEEFKDVFQEIEEMEEAAKVLHELQNTESVKINRTNIINVNQSTNAENSFEMKSETNEEIQYPCNLCHQVVDSETKLIHHKEVEHNIGPRFICSKCDKIFKSKQLLQRHQVVHSDLRPYICKHCGSAYKTKTNLQNHLISHSGKKNFECHLCDQQFAHKTSLSLHLRWHNGEKPFKCSVCNKGFTQYGNMQEHLRIHTGERPFECHTCGKKFKTSSQCRMHVKRHGTDRPLKCTMCDKAFVSTEEHKVHMRRHNNEKPFTCSVCSKSFIELCALRKHVRLHTGEKPYKCVDCGRSFADPSNLSKHVKFMHLKKAVDIDSSSKRKLPKAAELPLSAIGKSFTAKQTETTDIDNIWSLVEEDDGVADDNNDDMDASNSNDVNNQNTYPNNIIYVTYQDPSDPVGNKTTIYVVNNTAEREDSILDSTITTNSAILKEENSINEIDNPTPEVYLNYNTNDIPEEILLNMPSNSETDLVQEELFQNTEENETDIELITVNGEKVHLVNYSSTLNMNNR